MGSSQEDSQHGYGQKVTVIITPCLDSWLAAYVGHGRGISMSHMTNAASCVLRKKPLTVVINSVG